VGGSKLPKQARRFLNTFEGFQQVLQGQNGQPSRAQDLLTGVNETTLDLANQFAPQFQKLQQRLIQSDPILSLRQANAKQALSQQTSILSQLQGVVSDPNQLDPATARLVKDQIRSRFSSQGSLDSGGAALGEVTGMVRANFDATNQRINQLLSGLSGNASIAAGGIPTTPGVSGTFNPLGSVASPAGGLNNAIPSIISQITQQGAMNSQQQMAGQAAFGQGAGQLAGMALPNVFPGIFG
jgi:hypothetical protein